MVPVDSEAGASPHLATVVAVMNRSPHERRARRHALTTTALPLAVAVLTACAPAGEPSGVEAPDSIPTPFSNEEEAFRAAEATYRAYVDALNQVDLADPATFEPLLRVTTGDARKAVRETFRQMHDDQLAVRGESRVTLVEVQSASPGDRIELATCVFVGDVELEDSTGNSVVAKGRQDYQALTVEMVRSPAAGSGWLIANFNGRVGQPRCGS